MICPNRRLKQVRRGFLAGSSANFGIVAQGWDKPGDWIDPKPSVEAAFIKMRTLIAAALVATVLSGAPATAQLMLHNGSDSTAAPGGEALPSGAGSNGEAAPPKPKSIPMKPPGDESLIGHDLLRNGATGVMTFTRQGKDLAISRLAFDGEEISQPGQQCHVEINGGLPITMHPDGHPDGLTRYQVDLQACPFSLDVLEGAVLVSKGHACDFEAANCHVEPAGLWGPQGNTFSPSRIKEMEQARIRIESDMRANFRVLLSKAGKDKFSIKRIAAEQAGFSSDRETLCHAYALESVHGFCALEITRARVLALLAQLGAAPNKPEGSKPKPKKRQAPPAIAAEPPPASTQ